MNIIVLIGRLTAEPETSVTRNTGSTVCKFTLAVDRIGKDEKADFIRCACFGKSADFVSHYVHKADIVSVNGSLHIDMQEKDGVKRYFTEVSCNRVELIHSYKGKDSANLGNESVSIADAGRAEPPVYDDLPW